MRLFNRGSDKKGVFNFGCFWFVVIYCKNDFLNFLKREAFCNHFFQKLKGFFKKVVVSIKR
ncbi:hypothetical protein KVC10_00140 [Helicobacter pylori]|nr:hypothetical protein KVC10_00140 [Helicobacter pylori]